MRAANPETEVLAWLEARQTAARRAGRLWVTLAYAQSLDGSISAERTQPLALSGPRSLALTHTLRSRHAAILVGIGALLADNSRLTARLPDGSLAERQPQPVILDSLLRCPPAAAVFQHPHKPWLAALSGVDQDEDAAARRRLLEQNGARILSLPAGADGRIHLPGLLAGLSALGIDTLFVEGGAAVISAFLAAGLAQALVLTIAPRFVGGQNALLQRLDVRLHPAGWAQLDGDGLVWGELA